MPSSAPPSPPDGAGRTAAPPASRSATILGRRIVASIVAVAATMAGCAGAHRPSATLDRAPAPASAPSDVRATLVGTVADDASGDEPQPAAPLRVLLVGDSTLLAVRRYDAFAALQGFDYTFDAKSCRTLGVPSCGDPPRPTNTVEAITAASGAFDIVVVMAGYDEWWTSFPASFDRVMAAARAKGARRTVWLTYREGVDYRLPDGSRANAAFVENNRTLRSRAVSGQHPDAIVADWFHYTAEPGGWISTDGIHLSRTGAFAVADYISRVVAHVEGRPCPVPWEADGAIDTMCPNPDVHGRVRDVMALYR